MYYYTKLNENQIATEIITRHKKLTDISGLIELPDYNETYLYRKWDGEQWSGETYEPSFEAELQEAVTALQEENVALKVINENLQQQIVLIQQALDDLLLGGEL